ncbi:helix-turn-helix domain-containing protein [Lactococcus lactis]|uniref:helix-turn-helix domain-containing protein n=1 Tax=Lactococcus lactis TaxID=1358 RepID=UPI0025A0ED4B|nr:helix-turn-helix domain-containing protein [Lactococcus lactis]MDM7501761.1 helix-turn-helix domain-containing protein [Lactococcus lactis]MDM7520714.1 helix-turn-helix domain-containing protein [Lactococcus lactis]
MEQSTKFFNQIPVPIVEADDLNDFEKLLFSEIYTMANSFGSVFPSNGYLAKRYGKTTWTVSTTLKKLQEKGYIKMEYEFEGKEVKKRYIHPYLDLSKGGIVKNLNTPSEKSKGGIVKNLKDNISTNKSTNNISDKSDKESDLETRFNNLWKLYPNKKGRKKALLAYKRAVKSGTTDEEIKTGLENYLEEIRVNNTQQNYIKHGSTWFNGKGWEDDYDLIPIKNQTYNNNKVVKSAPNWSNQRFEKDEETLTAEEFEEYLNGLDS